ncbi:unnamed protein product [Absidia cylindrospora]
MFPRTQVSDDQPKDLSSADAPFTMPTPSRSLPRTKSHQQNTFHAQWSLDYLLEPTYADFLSSIDDWLDPYSLPPSESHHLKPRSRSLHGAAIPANLQPDNTHSARLSSYQKASKTKHTQSQAPRAKSRILKSPPPPPESDQQPPPSLPNVNIQQIKNELSVSVSINHHYVLGGHANPPMQQPSPRRSRHHHHQRHASSSTTSKETASVINNVKRRLSLKDRVTTQDHQMASIDPQSTHSLPSAMSEGRKSRTLLADSQGTSSFSATRRRSVYSPPPPLRYTKGDWTTNDDDDGSAISISSALDQDQFIPPVPPVPKHHSIPTNSNTSSFISVTTTTTSTTDDDDMPSSMLDSYRDTFDFLDQDAQNSLQVGTNRQSWADTTTLGDGMESCRQRSSRDHNEHAGPNTPSSTATKKSGRGISPKTISHRRTEDGKKVVNRKRGRTLPGSLATPPPIPSLPLPPMKLEPISADVLRPPPLQSSKPTTPAQKSPSAPSRPWTPSEDNRISRRNIKPSVSHSTTLTPSEERQSSKSSSFPRMRHSRSTSNSGKGLSASVLSPPSVSFLTQLLKRKSPRKAPNELDLQLPTAITSYDFMTEPPKTSSTTPLKLNRTTSLHSIGSNKKTEQNNTTIVEDRPRTMTDSLPSQHPPTSTTYQSSSSTSTKNTHEQQSTSTSHRSRSVRTPKSPQTALKCYYHYLSQYERTEILDFKHIYFIGPHAKKHQGIITTRDHHHHHHHQQQQQEQSTPPSASVYNSGYDDENGDYKIIRQDHLMYRYEIVQVLGQGSFGQVVRCVDYKTGDTVAIKLIRNKQRFQAQALTEIKILRQLVDWDPEDKHHNIRMVDYFYFRHHLCIVFECMSMNLYELIKKNNFQGFGVGLIRTFTVQMLRSLVLLYKHQVVHCDLKPENILLKDPNKNIIKVIDFGSSCLETERVYTYIQSRFYRSPEVILGISYNMAIDMWSLGCILAELHTGIPLFPGESEQEQLGCIMEVLGLPDRHVIDQSSRKKLFFGKFPPDL